MVRDFTWPRMNQWEGTLRRDPEAWTAQRWAEVYNFPKKENGSASSTNKYGSGEFSNPVNSKDTFAVSFCVNPKEKRILEFVLPILYPEKPTKVIVTMINTIFGSMSGERPVSWGVFLQFVVEKLVSGVGKGKPSPICPYLFHLYVVNQCLR